MKEKNSQHWASDPEKVEAFVLHQIDESERVSCTEHLNQCEECRRVVQEERELVAGIRYVGRKEMKLRLRQWIQRGQGKRFDWTQAASLAAAIILMLGAVFTGRWFFDAEKEKAQVREIVLQESKPEERAIWIIGKVIEIKDKSGYLVRSRTSTAPIADNELAFRDHARSEAEASPAIVSEENTELHDAVNSKTKDALASRAIKSLEPQADVTSRAMKSATPMLKKMSDSRDSLNSETKESPTVAVEDKLGSRVGFGSSVNRGSAPTIENKSEMRKPALAKVKTGPTMVAKKTLKNVPAVLVCRGDMKNLPASMKNGDESVIHTRMERTPKGGPLTFYSSTIIDSVATDIEAIAPDSIIVTFRNRQIVYHIPGGWAGKM